jgi:hypothetical protein
MMRSQRCPAGVTTLEMSCTRVPLASSAVARCRRTHHLLTRAVMVIATPEDVPQPGLVCVVRMLLMAAASVIPATAHVQAEREQLPRAPAAGAVNEEGRRRLSPVDAFVGEHVCIRNVCCVRSGVIRSYALLHVRTVDGD